MDAVNYQAIQQNSPWNYSEHRAVNSAVSATTLTTLMSVTGKGMLDEALVIVGSANDTTNRTITTTSVTSTTEPELVVTVDGTVIMDIAFTVGTFYGIMGLYPASDMSTFAGTAVITALHGVESMLNYPLALGVAGIHTTFTFPGSTKITIPMSGGTIDVPLAGPIYFNKSLLIQIKGVPCVNGCPIVALAKARY